jgi:three-Cys-motif partner protein
MGTKGKHITRKRKSFEETDPYLFTLPPETIVEPLVERISHPIWTENKAKLIERYLFYFIQITKHGCYVDGFAGPQQPDKPETWAAKLVLEIEPTWLTQFHLFESDNSKIDILNDLRARHADRKVEIYLGDFNQNVSTLLDSGAIGQKEAAFCLIDQRTFECHWSTLLALAKYKSSNYKIELFYFFANSWFDRAFAAQKDKDVLNRWWGKEDWECLRPMKSADRINLMMERFKKELGYKSVKPWPIYERKDGGRIMYYMIHATDHLVAPSLMSRAYKKALGAKEPAEQFLLEFYRPSEGKQGGK